MSEYRAKKKIEHEERIRQIQKELPPIVRDFMLHITNKTDLTRLGYIQDLRTFFYFLPRELPEFAGLKPSEITVEQLGRIPLRDFNVYKDYLGHYIKPNYGDEDVESVDESAPYMKSGTKEGFTTNDESGIARKLCALRAFYRYLYLNRLIPENITANIEVPSPKDKEVIYLDRDEIARLLHAVQTGEGMTARQKHYQDNMRLRDIAIIYLLVGTGIRASECVGLDIEHFNLEKKRFYVVRKGGKEEELYFNDDIKQALEDYLEVRKMMTPEHGHEKAMFLSTQMKRITTRALQNLVKKYAEAAVPEKTKISPHKMRSSFGTALYEASHDINRVANVLGHRNINTTKKHYIHDDKKERQNSADMVNWTHDA